MALRMIHLVAFHCEDGILIGMHDNHVDRDRDLEAAHEEWRADGNEGDSPTQKIDTFVPMDATTPEINRMIRRVMERMRMAMALEALLGQILR